MHTKYVRADGKIVPNNDATNVTHHLDTFTVIVRSDKGVTIEEINTILEKHFKVVQVHAVERFGVSK